MLIINADDWGGWKSATDSALNCFVNKRIDSVSAMVWMKDAERAAELALEYGIDAGIHLNFDFPYTQPPSSPALVSAHERTVAYLTRSKLTQLVYNPSLTSSFRDLIKGQLEQFYELYNRQPSHLDGHHHMHLCSNIWLGDLLPKEMIVRRSFSFRAGQKGSINILYRNFVSRMIARKRILMDYFFSLPQSLAFDGLAAVRCLAHLHTVELMTHPEETRDSAFLLGTEFEAKLGALERTSFSSLSAVRFLRK